MNCIPPIYRNLFDAYDIRFDRYSIENIGRKQIVIIDEKISEIYGINDNINNIITIQATEENKSYFTINKIYSKMLGNGVDRNTEIIGIGGGITCDIAAYAASTFMRGLKLRLVPTTLLAQCDAAIGGKNGINFNGAKNIIGTIRQPEEIIIDIAFLNSLPDNVFSEGFAEIIKIAAIADEELFEMLEKMTFDCNYYNEDELEKIIQRAVYNKLLIVQQDEKESGLRRILNFGHTLAHSLEAVYGISHGQAVALGMDFAAKLSTKRYNADSGITVRLEKLLKKFRLHSNIKINPGKLIEYIKLDKKREDDFIHFAVLREIGKADTIKIKIHELTEEIYAVYHD